MSGANLSATTVTSMPRRRRHSADVKPETPAPITRTLGACRGACCAIPSPHADGWTRPGGRCGNAALPEHPGVGRRPDGAGLPQVTGDADPLEPAVPAVVAGAERLAP